MRIPGRSSTRAWATSTGRPSSTGPGAVVGDGQSPPSPEEIMQSFDAVQRPGRSGGIRQRRGRLRPHDQRLFRFRAKRKRAQKPQEEEGLTVKKIFDNLPGAFQADKASGVDVVFRFDISGLKGGTWSAVIKDGTCTVVEGGASSPHDHHQDGGRRLRQDDPRGAERDGRVYLGDAQNRGRPHEIPTDREALQVLKGPFYTRAPATVRFTQENMISGGAQGYGGGTIMATGIRDKVAIIGMGCTRFGERWDVGAEELMVEAFTECIEDAGIDRNDIEAAWLGTCIDEVNVGKSALPLSVSLRLPMIPSDPRGKTTAPAARRHFGERCTASHPGRTTSAWPRGVEKLKDTGYGGLPAWGSNAGSLMWLWWPNLTAPGAFCATGVGLRGQAQSPRSGPEASHGAGVREKPRQTEC